MSGQCQWLHLFNTQEPDEFYEGITFEHFLKVGEQNKQNVLQMFGNWYTIKVHLHNARIVDMDNIN